jgi:hypothetical protein
MRRIGRWLFNAAAAISLVLCVAALLCCVLLADSYRTQRLAGYTEGDGRWLGVGINRGVLDIINTGLVDPAYGPAHWYFAAVPSLPFRAPPGKQRIPGVWTSHTTTLEHGFFDYYTFEKHLFVSWWIVVPAPALYLVAFSRFWWVRFRRWRRSKQGRCIKCGYDLRASPEICPECGTAIGQKVGAC